MAELRGAVIQVRGVVQGVGFRPFVYGLALRHALAGMVRNTTSGVDIEVDGMPDELAAFLVELRELAPPLARIDEIVVHERPANGYVGFEIVESASIPHAFQPISPDMAICNDCLRELFDPKDRRYRYPFVNCTNCGPRFTIIRDLPYDRPNTTMASFAMCEQCAAEYTDPRDRRFHAQPVACPRCGPQVWLMEGDRRLAEREEAIQAARERLRQGQIIAVKGLGGFHLACDATDPQAVGELRRRKLRVGKPFAVMFFDVGAVERHCQLHDEERRLLCSPQRPIVIAARRDRSTIDPAVSPGQRTLGVMLPYTPLHYLLLEPAPDMPEALVMTSGNRSEEPIATDNEDARERLAGLADCFLLHDRPIHMRCDDSVVRLAPGSTRPGGRVFIPVRRARGYAPLSILLPWKVPPLAAVGGELKNTFCLTREEHAFLSHHIGDLENYETLRSFEDGIQHFERLFRIQPRALSYDLHPDYLATRYALERSRREGIPAFGIQHHHAHIAACMADNGVAPGTQVLGVAFDGTGYGDDGSVWGGEFLLCDYRDYCRVAHLEAVPLLGGDRAIREPWRMALTWLWRAGVAWEDDLPPVRVSPESSRRVLRAMLERGSPAAAAPMTTSIGRLFDAVSSLLDLCHHVTYEGQAAMELESLVDQREDGAYEFRVSGSSIDPSGAIQELVRDLRRGVERGRLASRFHRGLARAVVAVCRAQRDVHDVEVVALSGGVWQNCVLLAMTLPLLEGDGFKVLLHRQVPPNDGGLALGQAVVAAARLRLDEE